MTALDNETPADRAIDALEAAHQAVASCHADSRRRLLGHLSDETTTPPAPVRTPRGAWWLGGVGATAACAAIVVMVFAATAQPLSAMERMARAVEKVTSYSWRMESVYVSTVGEGRTVRDVNVGRWRRDPHGLHATMRVTETPGTPRTGPDEPTVLVDLEETHGPTRGVVIDHRRREYFVTPGLDGVAPLGSSPQAMIFKVRTRRGRVLEELGERKVDGRLARGVRIELDDADPATEAGPATPATPDEQARGWDWRGVAVEAWFDPATDLPIEFSMTRRGDDFETTYRYTDLRWNLAFDPGAFEPTAPEGYRAKTLDEVDTKGD